MREFRPTASALEGRILFGAAYYQEYQEGGTLDRDLDLMAEAAFTVIRVGESVWSTWEPRDGEYDLDWMQPVLDGAHDRGIGVILGTPTYAIPPWLQTKHPEFAIQRADGSRIGWGARQEVDFTNPEFLPYAERVIRKILERYASHPAVIGFQVDNEPGAHLIHNEHTFAAFLEWLRQKYGDVGTLNEEWGLVYWSHRIAEWEELWTPDGNAMPQYQLEWRRFQAKLVNDYIAWQSRLANEYASDTQFVMTCISYERLPVEDDRLVESLDVVAGNPYYLMQDGLAVEKEMPRTARWWTTGVWALFGQGDRMYATTHSRYLVTETAASSIGGPWQNLPPYPGQLAQAALALIARGATMIEYWHWHTLHFGVETYWGGILPHSQRPGRLYREAAELGALLGELGPQLAGYVPDADITFLYSNDTKWSFDSYPPLPDAAGNPDAGSYLRILDTFARGAFEAGLQARLVHANALDGADVEAFVDAHPVVVAAAFYVATDAQLEFLRAYAEAGGHLVLGIRTGYGDELARARKEVAPGRFADAAGVWYDEYSNIAEPVAVEAENGFQLSDGAAGTAWVDALQLDGAEPLARYVHHVHGASPAVTTRAVGSGRITYVGTLPNRELARDVASWLVQDPIAGSWSHDPTVTVSSGVAASGTRFWFLHNWSERAATAVAPVDLTNSAGGARVSAGATISLDPWAVEVFGEN
ncbi:beta-galactosidase [Lysobacter korlensis]|uniref:beta-galactosidase n=1 Tax=Lysobacter korlensis TaxID=553636 RepID=A0ABV6RU46_9GAMM